MEYSYEVCKMFGDVFVSDDRKGCALIVMPEKKKTTLKSIMLDAKFAISCLGLLNIKKAMTRETKIKQVQPDGLLYYLWFIGVDPSCQNKGTGSSLLAEIITEAEKQQRTVCLETSTVKNIPWYQKFGFTIYNEFDFGYRLYCLKRDMLK